MTDEDDPILQMRGVGKEIWADTNADDYVRSLRSNWFENDSLDNATDSSNL